MSTLRVDSIRGQTAGTNRYVVQVVSAENSTANSTQSTSYVDTGLSATITPSSTNNKILVIVQNCVYAQTTSSNGSGTETQIHRGSTAIGQIAITRVRENTGSSATQNVQGGGHLHPRLIPAFTRKFTLPDMQRPMTELIN